MKANKWFFVLFFGLTIIFCPVFCSATPTHLGVKPSNIVFLRAVAVGGISPSEKWVFKRQLSNGTLADNEFVVPERQVLIITDIHYLFGGDLRVMSLVAHKGTTSGAFYTIRGDQPVPLRDHLTAGIVVPSGGVFAIGLSPDDMADLGLTVIGYLTPDR